MTSLSVMTFNVRGSYRDRGKRNSWRNRAESNVALILAHAPALIGFQEFQRGNLDTYTERLHGYAYVLGPHYGNRRPRDWNAIFFDPERLEVVAGEGFWLSKNPGRRSRSWGSAVARSANAVTFREAAGARLVHLNTHLDHRSAPARREGAALVIRRLAAYRDLPTLVTGDFNCRPGSDPYRLFADAGFADTYLAAGNTDGGDGFSFHAFRGGGYRDKKPKPVPRRIDWILLRDPAGAVRVEGSSIIRTEGQDGVYPSDHYPVISRLEL